MPKWYLGTKTDLTLLEMVSSLGYVLVDGQVIPPAEETSNGLLRSTEWNVVVYQRSSAAMDTFWYDRGVIHVGSARIDSKSVDAY